MVDDSVERVLALLGLHGAAPREWHGLWQASARAGRTAQAGGMLHWRRGAEHQVRILGPAAAAVVAAQRQEQVAALAVEVVAQDDAAEAQVGLHVEQRAAIAVADQAGPERHHLHVAARADAR